MCSLEVVLPGPGCFSACQQGWAPALSLVVGALQFGAWAPGSLRPWAFPVPHQVSEFLSIGTPVVPQALTLVCAEWCLQGQGTCLLLGRNTRPAKERILIK